MLRSMIESRDDVEAGLWYALFLKRLPEELALPEPIRDETLAPAMRRIMTSYDDRLTVDELAAECGLCRSWFAKRFRKEYHMSPIEFLNDFRTKAAARLLESGISVTDAAMLTGFGSVSDLYRNFTKRFGCPPSAFRKGRK